MNRRKKRVGNAEAATRSRIQAERDLEATKAQTPKYRALAESLRELRRQNHFAESIAATFRGEQ